MNIDYYINIIEIKNKRILELEKEVLILKQIVGDIGCGEEIILNEIEPKTESNMDREE